jgi:hypothetical protein
MFQKRSIKAAWLKGGLHRLIPSTTPPLLRFVSANRSRPLRWRLAIPFNLRPFLKQTLSVMYVFRLPTNHCPLTLHDSSIVT